MNIYLNFMYNVTYVKKINGFKIRLSYLLDSFRYRQNLLGQLEKYPIDFDDGNGVEKNRKIDSDDK